MQKITILPATTKDPITLMGECTGVCYGSDTSDPVKNYKRGKDCLTSGHGRALEYPQVYLVIQGFSARVEREIYTHIAGSPTRTQASTRYIKYGEFQYITPPSILKDPEAKDRYDWVMYQISEAYKDLEALGVPKEDIGGILPLNMESTMVIRTNARHLIDMSHQRMCSRALWEYRQFMNLLKQELSNYSPEWAEIAAEFKPKCELYGYCTEKFTCGRMPRKKELTQEKQEEEIIAAIEPALKKPGFMESLRKLIHSYLT